MTNRILFLDIDGVLNTDDSRANGVLLINDKLTMLNTLCNEVNCNIVISSSWKIFHNLQELKDILGYAGFVSKMRIIDVTPDSIATNNWERGYEIEQWLHHQTEEYNYAIVDDMDGMLDHQLCRYVQTDGKHGLTNTDIDRLKDIFNV